MKEAVIVVDNVWKNYNMGKVEVTVLKDINLSISPGEFVAIAGPSGSGKSTMMNLIGALDTPSKGRVCLKNKDVSDMSESSLALLRGKTIGFIFQQFNLIPTLNALQNVMLPMEFQDIPSKVAHERAYQLLKKLGLADRINHKPNELSGGERQRVAIARALANDPDMILADEPTGNLDSKTGQYVMDFLRDLNVKEGKTVVLVTHDLDLVKQAKRIVYIKDGKIEKDTKLLKGGGKK